MTVAAEATVATPAPSNTDRLSIFLFTLTLLAGLITSTSVLELFRFRAQIETEDWHAGADLFYQDQDSELHPGSHCL